jgi:hypothetical protein
LSDRWWLAGTRSARSSWEARGMSGDKRSARGVQHWPQRLHTGRGGGRSTSDRGGYLANSHRRRPHRSYLSPEGGHTIRLFCLTEVGAEYVGVIQSLLSTCGCKGSIPTRTWSTCCSESTPTPRRTLHCLRRGCGRRTSRRTRSGRTSTEFQIRARDDSRQDSVGGPRRTSPTHAEALEGELRRGAAADGRR